MDENPFSAANQLDSRLAAPEGFQFEFRFVITQGENTVAVVVDFDPADPAVIADHGPVKIPVAMFLQIEFDFRTDRQLDVEMFYRPQRCP